MKIALCIYRLPGPATPWDWRRRMDQARLLRRRANALAREGHQPVVLGQVDNLQGAANRCRAVGAPGLWLSCQSPMRGLRQEYLREPRHFADITLFVDGLVGPDLPPTAGQLASLGAMGFAYLTPEALPLGGAFAPTTKTPNTTAPESPPENRAAMAP